MDTKQVADGTPPRRRSGLPDDLDKAAITQAARALGKLRHAPRQQNKPDRRKWTGAVFGKRSPVGMPVVLDGEVSWMKCATRGLACVKTSKMDPVDGPVHEYCAVGSLRPFKLPAAVLLGKRKQGVKERKTPGRRSAQALARLGRVKHQRRQRRSIRSAAAH